MEGYHERPTIRHMLKIKGEINFINHKDGFVFCEIIQRTLGWCSNKNQIKQLYKDKQKII